MHVDLTDPLIHESLLPGINLGNLLRIKPQAYSLRRGVREGEFEQKHSPLTP